MNETERGGTTRVEIHGHPCEIFEPQRPNPHEYLVVYLHDVNQHPLSELTDLRQLCASAGLRAISPLTGSSWWTDRPFPSFSHQLTAERFVVQQIVAYASERWGVQPPKMALMGSGMGGQGALRIAFKHPDLFPIVAALSPAIDYHLQLRAGDQALSQLYPSEEHARQDTAILHVHPLYYPRNIFFCCSRLDVHWYDGAERLAMKLSSLGVPHECDLETALDPHQGDYHALLAERAVTYLMQRFDSERLRVV